MKIKIVEVMKVYDDYKPENKKYTLYSRFCKVNLDGEEVHAKIKTFTPRLELVAGAEFETDVNAGEIKVENKENNGKTYKEITIKAKPKEGFGGSKMTYQKFEKLNMQQLLFAVAESEKIVEGVGCITDKQKAFETLLDIMCDHVELPKERNIDEVIKDAVKGEEVKADFDDNAIPF